MNAAGYRPTVRRKIVTQGRSTSSERRHQGSAPRTRASSNSRRKTDAVKPSAPVQHPQENKTEQQFHYTRPLTTSGDIIFVPPSPVSHHITRNSTAQQFDSASPGFFVPRQTTWTSYESQSRVPPMDSEPLTACCGISPSDSHLFMPQISPLSDRRYNIYQPETQSTRGYDFTSPPTATAARNVRDLCGDPHARDRDIDASLQANLVRLLEIARRKQEKPCEPIRSSTPLVAQPPDVGMRATIESLERRVKDLEDQQKKSNMRLLIVEAACGLPLQKERQLTRPPLEPDSLMELDAAEDLSDDVTPEVALNDSVRIRDPEISARPDTHGHSQSPQSDGQSDHLSAEEAQKVLDTMFPRPGSVQECNSIEPPPRLSAQSVLSRSRKPSTTPVPNDPPELMHALMSGKDIATFRELPRNLDSFGLGEDDVMCGNPRCGSPHHRGDISTGKVFPFPSQNPVICPEAFEQLPPRAIHANSRSGVVYRCQTVSRPPLIGLLPRSLPQKGSVPVRWNKVGPFEHNVLWALLTWLYVTRQGTALRVLNKGRSSGLTSLKFYVDTDDVYTPLQPTPIQSLKLSAVRRDNDDDQEIYISSIAVPFRKQSDTPLIPNVVSITKGCRPLTQLEIAGGRGRRRVQKALQFEMQMDSLLKLLDDMVFAITYPDEYA